jgi:uncharacterized protein (DUF2141 family)
MKTTAATLILVLSLFTGLFAKSITPTADSATYKLTVVVSEVNNRTGKLYIGLANDETTFKGQSVKNIAIDVPASGEITVTFDGLTPGRYAVRLYQDLNSNQKLDFSGQMPAEPFGFSNVTRLMGPPSFDQCSFELTESKAIRISMMEM